MMFTSEGFFIVEQVLSASQCAVAASRITLEGPGAGSRRLLEQDWCQELAHQVRAHAALAQWIGPDLVAVQCNYFEKSADRNWLVPLHQDLGIPVAAYRDEPGLRGWSHKHGTWFVRPALAVLEQLVAVRVHLDPCGGADGPLRVVPGSHQLGCLDQTALASVRDRLGEVVCPVGQGGVLVMRPLLLHASSKGTGGGQRRVLHFVFGPSALPQGLQWQVARRTGPTGCVV